MPNTSVIPVNYREPDARPEAIARDVDYAVQVGLSYAHWIADALGTPERTLAAVRGLDVFELGPGPSLGPAALLACGGARVTVCDRFAARWDDRYHPAVFEALLARVEQLLPGSGTPIIRLLDARAFVPDVIDVRECPAEDLDRLPGGHADVVISNAVLEHVMDVPRAFAGLAHVGRPGSVGIHQVDFRDHRDFSKPLEYLTLSAATFGDMFAEQMGECGNRWRPRPMAAAFEAAGFTVRALHPNMWAEADYVSGIKPRLHPDVAPIADIDLSVISAQFVVDRRPRA
ncbi:MAG: methyltransferase domain-containing protein [Acidobacteriota bacterium]